MSMEQAKAFIERMKTDEAFRAKVTAVEDVAERIRLANAEGYDFTEEEIKTVLAEGDDAVRGVAGGGGPIRCFMDCVIDCDRCARNKPTPAL